MRKFYFVGGPKQGFFEEFFQRLVQIEGSPAGWKIFPHASNDGKALHIVEAETKDEISGHLQRFDDIYERGEIIEIVEKPIKAVDI
ncbi:MAG: hypothetical protein M1461_02130 [Nitrospirae bacterium]|nr:hypothetical protein [Nitrospirota bacterium]